MPDGKEPTACVNRPVPPEPDDTGALYVPGEVPHSIPLSLTVVELATVPPRVAVVSVTFAKVGKVTVGTVAAAVGTSNSIHVTSN